MTRVCVVGLGYVGLPTAVIFASKGFSVIGVDVDREKVMAVNSGRCYIKEHGLDVLLRDAVSKGLLRATTDVVEAVRQRDAVIIAVPTPIKDGVADLSYLRDALEAVKKGLYRGMLVVIESTIPPGTTIGFAKPLLTHGERYTGPEDNPGLACWRKEGSGGQRLMAKLRRQQADHLLRLCHIPAENVILGLQAKSNQAIKEDLITKIFNNYSAV